MFAHERHFLGIDLGGTGTGIGIVNDRGKLKKWSSFPTEAWKGPEYFVKRVGETVRELIGKEDFKVSVAGLGAPGPLDTKTGIVFEMPNLGWKDVPLASMIENELNVKTFIDNDANAAAFGEWWVGAGVGARALVCFTLGTGVGGGIVLDGDVYRGTSDAAGEFGHMIIVPDGRGCACGKSGCLEAYASATAIAARAREKAKQGSAPSLLQIAGGKVDSITSELVSKAAAAGDEVSRRILQDTAFYLALGISNILNAINPDVVVIAGGVIGAGELLFEPLRNRIRELSFDVLWRTTKIVPARLGIQAGTVGAAGTAMRREDLG